MLRIVALTYSCVAGAGLIYAWIGHLLWPAISVEHLMPYVVGYVVALPLIIPLQMLDPGASGIWNSALRQLGAATAVVVVQAGVLWIFAQRANRRSSQ